MVRMNIPGVSYSNGIGLTFSFAEFDLPSVSLTWPTFFCNKVAVHF